MLYKKSVDITIEQFFIDKKKEIIDTYNSLLLKALSGINCNKFAIVNKFSDTITNICNAYYNKLLESYETNEVIDITISYSHIAENFLNTIDSYFEEKEDLKKVAPIINELTKNLSYSLISLYKVAIENLISSEDETKKIS